MRRPSRRPARANVSYGWAGTRPMLKAVNGSAGSYPAMTVSTLAASSTVRQIGPTRVVMPAPIIPSRLTSSCVGARPTTLAERAGMRIDVPVSSPMEQVTRLADTETPPPELDTPGVRSVS